MARNNNRRPPLERLILRSLKNGIKTMGGSNNQLKPVLAEPRILTYEGAERASFLALLQYDASHVNHRFDQGAHAEEFAQLVARLYQESRQEA